MNFLTGQSGVGKSTIVNTLRGLRPKAPGAAEVSSVQMTGVKAPFRQEGYPSPFIDSVVYYDLPGYGTQAVSRSTFVERYDLLNKYDAFILVTEGRVDESDVLLYDLLKRQHGRNLFLVRNKVNRSRGCTLAQF